MIAKIALLFALVAASQATLIGPGLISPLAIPTTVKTGSVVSIPGATTVDTRVIGTNGLIGAPLLSSGLIGAPVIGKRLIGSPLGINSGLIGAPLAINSGLIGAPLAINSGLIAPGLVAAPGIISPLGSRLLAPGLVKTILK
ncbi:uncharacterized protein [Parasteatoda tepidariorum]|uniref:uncharacterized protein n=1 Tax=Parasteatoda tepidariorum TaxID=114398 RepID=UPI001C71BBF8|nr:uncharacterized protein LOC122268843 [Parasteatoda tepidariorum]